MAGLLHKRLYRNAERQAICCSPTVRACLKKEHKRGNTPKPRGKPTDVLGLCCLPPFSSPRKRGESLPPRLPGGLGWGDDSFFRHALREGRGTEKERERKSRRQTGTVPLIKRAADRPGSPSRREADPYPRKSDSGRNRAHSPSFGKCSTRFRISLSNEKCAAKQYDTGRNPCQGKPAGNLGDWGFSELRIGDWELRIGD